MAAGSTDLPGWTITGGSTTVTTQTFTSFVRPVAVVPEWAERQSQFVSPGSSVRIRFSTPDSTGSGPVIDDVVQTYPNTYVLISGAVPPPAPFDGTFRYQIRDFDILRSQPQVTIRLVPEPGFAALLEGGASGPAALARRRRVGSVARSHER